MPDPEESKQPVNEAGHLAGEIRLPDLESQYVPSMAEVGAIRVLSELQLRAQIARIQIILFACLNLVVGFFVGWAVCIDYRMMRLAAETYKSAVAAGQDPSSVFVAERIVSSEVIIALIAGTVTQVGASMFAIVLYLFPRHHPRDNQQAPQG